MRFLGLFWMLCFCFSAASIKNGAGASAKAAETNEVRFFTLKRMPNITQRQVDICIENIVHFADEVIAINPDSANGLMALKKHLSSGERFQDDVIGFYRQTQSKFLKGTPVPNYRVFADSFAQILVNYRFLAQEMAQFTYPSLSSSESIFSVQKALLPSYGVIEDLAKAMLHYHGQKRTQVKIYGVSGDAFGQNWATLQSERHTFFFHMRDDGHVIVNVSSDFQRGSKKSFGHYGYSYEGASFLTAQPALMESMFLFNGRSLVPETAIRIGRNIIASEPFYEIEYVYGATSSTPFSKRPGTLALRQSPEYPESLYFDTLLGEDQAIVIPLPDTEEGDEVFSLILLEAMKDDVELEKFTAGFLALLPKADEGEDFDGLASQDILAEDLLCQEKQAMPSVVDSSSSYSQLRQEIIEGRINAEVEKIHHERKLKKSSSSKKKHGGKKTTSYSAAAAPGVDMESIREKAEATLNAELREGRVKWRDVLSMVRNIARTMPSRVQENLRVRRKGSHVSFDMGEGRSAGTSKRKGAHGYAPGEMRCIGRAFIDACLLSFIPSKQ